MTKLFKDGIAAVEALSPEEQDLAGAMLLDLARSSQAGTLLTPEQVEDVKLALEEMERGEFATDAEIEDAWKRFER